ncbi:MAG: hypothetical protein ACOX22_05540 [Caldicoprobacterales bacterium]
MNTTVNNLGWNRKIPKLAFRTLDSDISLDYILCIKEERTIIEGSAFSYQGQYYQLTKNGKKAAMPKAKLTVLNSSRIGVKAIYADIVYDTKALAERPKKAVAGSSKAQDREQGHKRVRPANDHPWRQSPDKKPTLSYAETDTEIIEMLNDLFSSTRAWA